MTNHQDEKQFPQLNPPITTQFTAYSNDTITFTLRSLDNSFSITRSQIESIVAACNEELIYRFLFQHSLQGRPYNNEDAREFITWAQKGWEDKSHFVFIILDSDNNVIGCIDISSNDIEHSPIGYWVTNRVKGIMTNAVKSLIKIARNAGYKYLYAMVEPANIKSSSLLKRTGFTLLGIRSMEMRFMGESTGKHQLFEIYELILS